MSCCGSNRGALRRQSSTSTGAQVSAYRTFREMDFEYSGPGKLTVTGPLTGRVYTFSAATPKVRIHASDIPSIAAVPGLRPAAR